MTFKKALITGGAGFIGSHLTRALIDKGLETVVLDNLSMGKEYNIPKEAAFVKADIRQTDALKKCLAEVDVVFHLAAKVSIRASVDEFYDDAENNFMGTVNLLQALSGSNVKKIIFASSMAVYADSPKPVPIKETHLQEPISPYGIAKLASEKYCLNITKSLGVKCVVLRYFNTYGPGQTYTPYVGVATIFINRLKANQPPVILGDGEQRRDFVHVSDIVQANIKTMDSDVTHEIFNVGTGKATSVNKLAQLLINKINPGIKPAYAPQRPGELRYSIADIGKARTMLGYEPLGVLEKNIGEVISFINP